MPLHVVKTKTTYLEMRSPPASPPLPVPAGVEAVQGDRPDAAWYRQLYRSVGAAYCWVDRLMLSDEQLCAIIQHEGTRIYVLQVTGKTAGYVELDCRAEQEIEIAYFGLRPEFLGRGLGRFFLNWVVHKAWSFKPRRLWLHTCDLDHPAALPNYLSAGFQVYHARVVEQIVEARHTVPESQDSSSTGKEIDR